MNNAMNLSVSLAPSALRSSRSSDEGLLVVIEEHARDLGAVLGQLLGGAAATALVLLTLRVVALGMGL